MLARLRVTVVVVLSIVVPLVAGNAAADPHGLTLTNLTAGSGLVFGSGLSLNEAGTIGTISDGDFYLIDRRGNIERLTDLHFLLIGQGSINNRGQAVFQLQGDAIFFDGTSFHNLTNGTLTVESAGLLGKTLNDRGQIAFGTGTALILFERTDGTAGVDVTAGTGIICCQNSPPSLNDKGNIAFAAIFDQRRDAFLFNGTSIVNISSDPSLHISDVEKLPVINSHGDALFIAHVTGSAIDRHLFLFDGRATIDLTTTCHIPIGDINAAAINKHGEIVFTANGHELWFLEGCRLERLAVGLPCTDCLSINDKGEIAFVQGQDVMLAARRGPR